MTMQNEYSSDISHYRIPTPSGEDAIDNPNYEKELLASILNDNSEEDKFEDEFEEKDINIRNAIKQKPEYLNNEEETDYKKTHKKRKQKTKQHLTEILR